MKLPIFIAYRYLFSKKKINAINVINGIAMLGFGVGAFAMIVILSAFNGFERLVGDLINNYDPDIEISSSGKKVFIPHEELLAKITAIEGVDRISKCLEEKVVVKFNERQEIARIKGVDEHFNIARFDSLLVLGELDFGDTSSHFGVFGGGLSGRLGVFPGSHETVSVFIPRRDVEYNSLNPMSALSVQYLRPSGIFVVHEEIDNEVFITSLDFASELLDYPNEISSLEIDLDKNVDEQEVKDLLQQALGEKWQVVTRREQNEVIYKIFQSEKWFTYAILSLVLLISAFNIFGSLIMLVLDKRKDISILKSMGATKSLIRSLFVWQGSYIAIIGGGVGLLLGLLTVLAQKQFGLLKLENSIVENYPVELHFTDVFITLLTIVLLGYVISIFPANKASRYENVALN
ncbi:MAG: ABC transporter permease [Bacteroidia bacterium]